MSTRAAVLQGDLNAAEATLLAAPSAKSSEDLSVTLARRAAEACGWLRNENDLPRAMELAERVLSRLRNMEETTTQNRVERLYWEAVLLASTLDRKADALALLLEAGQLAPNDDRLLACQQQLAQALAEFGR